MPQLILLCIQIICYCLAWALITGEIQPFLDILNIFSLIDTHTAPPQWIIHTNYLFTIILLITGFSATVRLKILSHFSSVALPFLIVLWLCLAAHPDLYFINLFRYAFIVLIPLTFYKIMNCDASHINTLIKATIQIALLNVILHIGIYLFRGTSLSTTLSIIITLIVVFIVFIASYGLYVKKLFISALKVSTSIFSICFIFNLLTTYLSGMGFNQISLILLNATMILFCYWVKKMQEEPPAL